MNDEQLLRYSRHILLNDIGIEGQEKLLASHAVVIGAGGLGCTVGLFLGSAGVGRITLIDPDEVELTNLQRQIAHSQSRIGQPKVESLKQSIHEINPAPQIETIAARANLPLLRERLPSADVVIDCTDNYASRQLINLVCVEAGKPLVSGSATGWDAQLAVYDPRDANAPCYACVFDPNQPAPDAHCATMGVVAPLVGMIGCMQALLALRVLCGLPVNAHELLLIDGRSLQQQNIKLARNPSCPVCANQTIG